MELKKGSFLNCIEGIIYTFRNISKKGSIYKPARVINVYYFSGRMIIINNVLYLFLMIISIYLSSIFNEKYYDLKKFMGYIWNPYSNFSKSV